jgi:flagellar motor switch protein FliM
MADVLSQTEVESLLSALETGSQKPQALASRREQPQGAISVYDFKRPERVSKEQMRAFQALHDGFSRELGAALSSMLRSIVEVKLISVDQLTYSEFVFSLDNPTCFTLLDSKGLDGHMILDINPAIIFPFMDRLLGGGREQRPNVPNRPLTDIEIRLVSRITELILRGLENAWSNLCPLDLKVRQVENNPQLIQIVPPNEVIVLISFEISMGELRGIMNLCIPFNTIEPLAGKLSSDTWSTYSKKTTDPRQVVNLETGLAQAPVEMIVELARTTISAGEVMGLAVGDVILTETGRKQPLKIWIEQEPMFEGFPGAYKAHKAIRIHGRVQRPKDTVEEWLKAAPQSPAAPSPADAQKKPPEAVPKDNPKTPASTPVKPQPKKPPAG